MALAGRISAQQLTSFYLYTDFVVAASLSVCDQWGAIMARCTPPPMPPHASPYPAAGTRQQEHPSTCHARSGPELACVRMQHACDKHALRPETRFEQRVHTAAKL